MKVLQSITLLLIALIASVTCALPPFDPSQFVSTGTLVAPIVGTAANGGTPGGTFTVNNQVVIVPENFLVDVPTQTLSWPDFVKAIKGPIEIQVVGNRVGNTVVAGIAFAAEDPIQTHSGFVNFIDYATGFFKMGGIIGDATTGQQIVVQDFIGRYGRIQPQYLLFTADTDNPSVAALTGYPMCIPRTDPANPLTDDPLCPSKNRPKDAAGAFLTTFTMAAPTVPPGTGTGTDPFQQAPLQVGDYVTITGSKGLANQILATSLTANVAIFTAAGTKPVYVAINKMTFGVTDPLLPGSIIAQTVMEGFTTDPSLNVNLFALDVDPCTGATTNRPLATIQPDNPPLIPGVKGRIRYRPGKISIIASRQVFLQHNSGTLPASNGLVSGQFTFPVPFGGISFPALPALGAPLGAFNFGVLPWLKDGSGPYSGSLPLATLGGPVVGQMTPFPYNPVPAKAPATCPVPVAVVPTVVAPAGVAPAVGGAAAVVPAAIVPAVIAPVPVPAPVVIASGPKPDTLQIVSQSNVCQKGNCITNISAKSSSFRVGAAINPVLTMSISPPGQSGTMTLDPVSGIYILSLVQKTRATSLMITSDFGASTTRII